MHRMTSLLLAMSGLIVVPLIDSAIKGTLLMLVAVFVCLTLRRDSAATRHFVWVVAICLLIAMPVLSFVLPAWQVLPSWLRTVESPSMTDTVPSAISQVTVSPDLDMLKSSSASPSVNSFQPVTLDFSELPAEANSTQSDTSSISAVFPGVASTVEPSTNWSAGFALIWACGFVGLILRLFVSVWLLRQSANRCHSVPHGERLQTSLLQARAMLSIARPIHLLLDTKRSIPIVWGVMKTRLRLPAESVDWKIEDGHNSRSLRGNRTDADTFRGTGTVSVLRRTCSIERRNSRWPDRPTK